MLLYSFTSPYIVISIFSNGRPTLLAKFTVAVYNVQSTVVNALTLPLFRKMSELEDISLHIHDRISSLQRMLDLSVVGMKLWFI